MYRASLSDDSELFEKIMGETKDTSATYNTTNRQYGNGFMGLEDINVNEITQKGNQINNTLDLQALSESVESAFSNPPNIMDAFLNAPAVSHRDFVESKIAPPIPQPTTIAKGAEKVVTDAQKVAEANKKWMDVSTKQTEICKSIAQFECLMKDLVENMSDESTKPVFEALHKAFKDKVCSKI